jgi:hypothetical protein
VQQRAAGTGLNVDAAEAERQRDAAKRQVQRWCAQHPEFMPRVEQSMVDAVKDGQHVTGADVPVILAEHGWELPLSVTDLMRARDLVTQRG